MKKNVVTLFSVVSLSSLITGGLYIFLNDPGSDPDLVQTVHTRDVSTRILARAHRRMAELEDALVQSRQEHARDVAARSRRIRYLEQRVEQLRQRLNARASARKPKLDCATADPGFAMPTNRIVRDEDREKAVSGLENRLAAEAYNAEWTEAIESRMGELIAQIPQLHGNRLVHARCGTTFCKVEILHENASAESRFLATLASQTFLLEGFAEYFVYRIEIDDSRDSRVHSVYFVSGKGYELPVLFRQDQAGSGGFRKVLFGVAGVELRHRTGRPG